MYCTLNYRERKVKPGKVIMISSNIVASFSVFGTALWSNQDPAYAVRLILSFVSKIRLFFV